MSKFINKVNRGERSYNYSPRETVKEYTKKSYTKAYEEVHIKSNVLCDTCNTNMCETCCGCHICDYESEFKFLRKSSFKHQNLVLN